MALPLDSLVAQLKSAAEPTRLRLLAACATAELTVSDLTRILGQSQPRVSRHLKNLCDAGLLLRFRESHFVYYRVPAAGQPRRLVADLLATLSVDDETLRRDQAALERVQSERAERAEAVLASQGLAQDALADEAVSRAMLDLVDVSRLGDLLDIGTGTGRILELFGKHARSAVGIDISAEMLLVARSAVRAAGLNSVMVRHGDMYRLPYPDATFDTVTVDQVLWDADRPERVLAEAGRILKPGGQMIVVDVESDDDGSSVLARWAESAQLEQTEVRRLRNDGYSVVLAHLRHARDDENENEAA